MAARREPAVDDRDGGVRIVHERVGESHPHGSCPDHHVVDVHLDRHGPITATGGAAVKGPRVSVRGIRALFR